MKVRKKLPLGIQTFSEIIREGYVYVDKTEGVFELIDSGKYYFFSRPRRFGKSLLVSTLKELFSGNRELFRGLWIEDKIDWDRFQFPVISIDFSGKLYAGKKELEETLNFLIEENAAQHQICLQNKTYDKKFIELIKKLAALEKVVILIDEYDKPIIDYIDQKNIAKENREILRNFYSTIKACDEYIKFAFLTGVSKFSKVSVFSGLNNLTDITLDHRYTTLTGYTQSELETYFQERVSQTAVSLKKSREELLKEIQEWYNGYSWDGINFVYNPYSILNFFDSQRFENYWFSSGTPTFLIKLLQEKQEFIPGIEQYEADSLLFDSYEIENLHPIPILFQTGYITIKQVMVEYGLHTYRLSYPNREVRDSFLKYIAADLTGKGVEKSGMIQKRLVKSLHSGKVEDFIKEIQGLFASIPYSIFQKNNEAYYQTVIYLAVSLSGLSISLEVQTNQGRIDAVIEAGPRIYVTEFKLGTAAEALGQIKEKKYYQKYLTPEKQIILLGIGLSISEKNIKDFLIEPITHPSE